MVINIKIKNYLLIIVLLPKNNKQLFSYSLLLFLVFGKKIPHLLVSVGRISYSATKAEEET